MNRFQIQPQEVDTLISEFGLFQYMQQKILVTLLGTFLYFSFSIKKEPMEQDEK